MFVHSLHCVHSFIQTINNKTLYTYVLAVITVLLDFTYTNTVKRDTYFSEVVLFTSERLFYIVEILLWQHKRWLSKHGIVITNHKDRGSKTRT